MPDTRKHRGQHPEDKKLFASKYWPDLREAVSDLSWLWSRGYAETSSLKLVGDRYNLALRQRLAVLRSSCSDQSLRIRTQHEVPMTSCKERSIAIDGYNLLITIESALSGGMIFIGRDGCYRDLSSIHSTYRQVEETLAALIWIGVALSRLEPLESTWYLDSPISNSGQLKMLIQETASRYGWNWKVYVVHNPDRELIQTNSVIVSSDSWILDHTRAWTNLAKLIIESSIPDAPLIFLSKVPP